MVEPKSRIISSLSKLSDRDTLPIAVADLESAIKTLPSPDKALQVILNFLLLDPHKESLLASTHPSAASPHLPKILSHLLRRLKDLTSSYSSLRDACATPLAPSRPSTSGGTRPPATMSGFSSSRCWNHFAKDMVPV